MKKYENQIGIGIILMLFVFGIDFSHFNIWGSPELMGYSLASIFLPLLGFIIFIKGILNYRKEKGK